MYIAQHGKPRHSQSQGSVEHANQDVENMIAVWMADNNNNHWSEGLPFVQLSKNLAYHDGIKISPYEAMFGVPPRRGLVSSCIPRAELDNLETEEDLEE